MNSTYYQIKKGFATHNNLLIFFVAKPLAETAKAIYLYGHGTTESTKTGVCCRCGRTLMHPVSVELGIGPECGGHYHNWDLIGGYTPENLERLKGALKEIIIDCWIPKSQIVTSKELNEEITIPINHPMLNRKPQTSMNETPKRWAGIDVRDGEVFIKILFPYNTEDLNKVRSLPNRRYNADGKFWIIPFSVESAEKLKEWNFSLGPKLIEKINKIKNFTINAPETITKIDGLKGTLYPFQKKGVEFIENHNGRTLIADQMGLGKTIQTLAWLQLHPEIRPVLIVVPATVKFNWAREIQRWMSPTHVQIIAGETPTELSRKVQIFIINYDILTYWIDELVKITPQVLITDECHYYKNNNAKRTKAVKKLGKGIDYIIGTSGTPILNKPVEIYNAWHLIDPVRCPKYWDFAMRYCGAYNNGYGWDFSGATNTEELHEKLTSTIMIRRLKKEVLPDLPDKIRSFIPIELDNEREYLSAELDFISFVQKTKGDIAARRASNAAALAEIEGLKQLAVKGKLKQAIEWIRDFIEVDGKLVVFATHKFVIDTLMNEFREIAVKVDGSITGENRQRAVDDFQNKDDVRLFVGNIQAAGIGITLTASSNVVFLELPWSPSLLDQAEDRCHRIGTKYVVNIYYLLAINTIEEKTAHLLDRKRKVLDSVLDGKDTEVESLLSELIKEYE